MDIHGRIPRHKLWTHNGSLFFIVAIMSFFITLAACTGNANHRQAPITKALTRNCVRNRLHATPDSTDTPAFKQKTGEQCLFRGFLALSSPKTTLQAISEFHCALMFAPNRAGEAHRGLGAAYTKIGDVSKAILHLKSYLNLTPKANDQKEVEAEIRRLQKMRK